MMKLFAYLLFMNLFFLGCLEDTPRNRPTFAPFQSAVGDTQDDGDKSQEAPERPDGAVYLQSGHCGCQNGEPITLGNCAGFCEGKTNEHETLFVAVKVGAEIESSNLKDFYGWCKDPLLVTNPETGELEEAEEGLQAGCQVQVKDENGSLGSLGFEPKAGSSSFEVDITSLDYDKTYRLKVVETTSGASSTTIQVRKVSDRIADPVGGPVGYEPVKQYTCVNRSTSDDTDTGDTYFEDASRQHYYFIAEDRPEPLPQTYANLYCHDYIVYGTTPINRPLLEEKPRAFYVWDKWDPRFFDLDGPEENGSTIEIHKILQQKIKDLGYSSDTAPEVFFPLEWYNGPQVTNSEEENEAAEPKTMGYYMQPFVDQSTFRAYCPTAAHYNSDNPLFRAMKEVVAVDTEGLYLAKQNNVCDIILVRESVLKDIWFYIENGQHIEPNDETIRGKQIQFYWPADPESPYIKKSHQRVYTVKSPTDNLCGGAGSSAGSDPTQYPSHDKRIGCVPKLSQ